MNTGNAMNIAGWALILVAGNTLAQDLDQTIRIIEQPQAEMPAVVTDPIVLPEDVGDDVEAIESSAEGIATANAARQRREERTQIADEARESAADYADTAQDAAESFSRTDDFLPDVPEVPEVPDPTGGR